MKKVKYETGSHMDIAIATILNTFIDLALSANVL